MMTSYSYKVALDLKFNIWTILSMIDTFRMIRLFLTNLHHGNYHEE